MNKLNAEKRDLSIKILDDTSTCVELYQYVIQGVFMMSELESQSLALDIKSKGHCLINSYGLEELMNKISNASDFLSEFGLSFNYQLSPIK